MQSLIQIEAADRQLLSGIAGAMEESIRRSGEWVVCRPGCTQCCIGPFSITQLDAIRLRSGLVQLQSSDPIRAERVRARAAESAALEVGDGDELEDAPCPALDPESGRCDLYEARPVTCRVFGPATRMGEGGVGACELCYAGATDEEIAACSVEIDPDGLERELLSALDASGVSGFTTVARALAGAAPA